MTWHTGPQLIDFMCVLCKSSIVVSEKSCIMLYPAIVGSKQLTAESVFRPRAVNHGGNIWRFRFLTETSDLRMRMRDR